MSEIKDGWYWHLREGEEPEIVGIEDGVAYQAGSEVGLTLPGEPEHPFMAALTGRLVGPIVAPAP